MVIPNALACYSLIPLSPSGNILANTPTIHCPSFTLATSPAVLSTSVPRPYPSTTISTTFKTWLQCCSRPLACLDHSGRSTRPLLCNPPTQASAVTPPSLHHCACKSGNTPHPRKGEWAWEGERRERGNRGRRRKAERKAGYRQGLNLNPVYCPITCSKREQNQSRNERTF